MFGNKYSKGNRFLIPFWLEAISGTKLPKGLSLVQQNNSATQNREDRMDGSPKNQKAESNELAARFTGRKG